MKKIFIMSLISCLIFFTAIVKNSTKRIDDQIFTSKENIRGLKKDFDTIKLEHDYLSSAEKLLEFQNLYFENELIEKNIQNINIIHETASGLKIKRFKFIYE